MNHAEKYILFVMRLFLLALIILIILSVGIVTLIEENPNKFSEEWNGAFASSKLSSARAAVSPHVNSSESVASIDREAPFAIQLSSLGSAEIPAWITVDILPEDCNSRSNSPLEDITGIVIHYVGNPGISAENNRAYYDNDDCEVNSHFIVGLDGEIIQCVPLNEQSVASNTRNRDTISIEVCHPDESGAFTAASYRSLTRLTAWLCVLCDLDTEDIIRHYDITEKECPSFYVHNPDLWDKFKDDVTAVIYTEFRTSFAA